jgi:hypothetical protein
MNILASTLKNPLMADFCFSIAGQKDEAFSERCSSNLLLFALMCWLFDMLQSTLRLKD